MNKLLLSIFVIFLVTVGCGKVEPIDNSIELTKQDRAETSKSSEETVTPKETELSDNMDKTTTLEQIFTGVDAEKYLIEKVSELKEYEQYISQESDGEAFMVVESDGVLYDLVYKGQEAEYFMVYVGEQHEDYQVNWFWFYVSKNLNEVLWYDLVEAEVYSLSEWRNSSTYIDNYKSLIK